MDSEMTPLLLYPLELVSKAVRVLATHPGKIQYRVDSARTHLAGLHRLQLPPSAEEITREIAALLDRALKNKSGTIAPGTARRVAELVVDLQTELQTWYEDHS